MGEHNQNNRVAAFSPHPQPPQTHTGGPVHQHAVLKAPERTDRVNATSLQPRERRELQTRDRGREQAKKQPDARRTTDFIPRAGGPVTINTVRAR